jgi:hypothetical protein
VRTGGWYPPNWYQSSGGAGVALRGASFGSLDLDAAFLRASLELRI